MTHMRAKTWGRRQAVESVSFRVCLAPLESLVLPGVWRLFSRAAAPGCEGMAGASQHFPEAGLGAGLVARFRVLGTLVKFGSRVGASRSESTRGPIVCTPVFSWGRPRRERRAQRMGLAQWEF